MTPFALISLGFGILIGFFLRYLFAKKKAETIEYKIQQSLKEAEAKEKEIILGAEKQALELITRTKEEREKLLEDVKNREDRLAKKEQSLDTKENELLKLKNELNQKTEVLETKLQELNQREAYVASELERIASLSREEAIEILFKKIEKETEAELKERLTKLLTHQREELEKQGLQVILETLPRYTRSVISETTITIVSLENEDIKGRIIGKEGRNIRHFEKLTGVELIIDETPEIVTLSCFDPIRREIARVALNKLIKDGRIHPSSIEEAVTWAKEQIEDQIRTAGSEAAHEVGILDLPEELIYLLGRLKFRTSYGQNVLNHSIEVATFARMIAEELGLDADLAKRGGLLHDIGKSVDHEIEGAHLEIGIKILEKYGVNEKIVLAMRSHHETYPFAIPEAYVVLAADAISASRPGARSETTEIYLKRLQELEKISQSFEGVDKSYAISGGREVRIFVKADLVSDLEMLKLAKNIAKKIEQELKYPGEIKVVVIRETRAVEYAK